MNFVGLLARLDYLWSVDEWGKYKVNLKFLRFPGFWGSLATLQDLKVVVVWWEVASYFDDLGGLQVQVGSLPTKPNEHLPGDPDGWQGDCFKKMDRLTGRQTIVPYHLSTSRMVLKNSSTGGVWSLEWVWANVVLWDT